MKDPRGNEGVRKYLESTVLIGGKMEVDIGNRLIEWSKVRDIGIYMCVCVRFLEH